MSNAVASRSVAARLRPAGITVLRGRERALSALARFSPRATAYIDWLQPSKRTSWGGPMNGQRGRQDLVRELLRSLRVVAAVETGTYRGTTTEFLWHLTGGPVFSVERDPRYHDFTLRRFRGNPDVHLSLGDSRGFLEDLAADDTVDKGTVFFYLDAHWGRDLPLHEELVLIGLHWSDPVVMIDDFAVPGDPGYGFDDYGPGRRLDMEYLDIDELKSLQAMVPTLPSSEETGARRGCAVLMREDRAHSLGPSIGLRPV